MIYEQCCQWRMPKGQNSALIIYKHAIAPYGGAMAGFPSQIVIAYGG